MNTKFKFAQYYASEIKTVDRAAFLEFNQTRVNI